MTPDEYKARAQLEAVRLIEELPAGLSLPEVVMLAWISGYRDGMGETLDYAIRGSAAAHKASA